MLSSSVAGIGSGRQGHPAQDPGAGRPSPRTLAGHSVGTKDSTQRETTCLLRLPPGWSRPPPRRRRPPASSGGGCPSGRVAGSCASTATSGRPSMGCWSGGGRSTSTTPPSWSGSQRAASWSRTAGPSPTSAAQLVARRLLELVRSLPSPVWGRDELRTGEMWNSNSVIAWLLARSGLPTESIWPPAGGRAPGWQAGLAVAHRRPDGSDDRLGWTQPGLYCLRSAR